MSIKFTDFYKKDSGGFHYPFGKPVTTVDRNPFFDWHLKKYYYPATPVQDFVRALFPAAALFENNKFSKNTTKEFDHYSYDTDVAYHFDAIKFGSWLREKYCIPRGVIQHIGSVSKVNMSSEGIESLILEDNSVITADLFIDCTGFKSLLLGEHLLEPFISYSNILPNNRAWATRLEYKDKEKELEPFTNSTAIGNGWCWNIPLWSRLGTGYVYSDKFITPEQAKEEFKNYLMSEKMVVPRTKEEVESLSFKDINMRVGIHQRTFVKNVVAIGLSAGFIEPLESNGLFSVHEFLFKLVDILQRGDISQFDRDMYNVSVIDLFNGFSKFVALHYALSHRDDTEYWRALNDREFKDAVSNEPYTPYQTKTGAFTNMGYRYMDAWVHDYGNGGITYIATGMNIRMINDARIANMSFRYKRDYLAEINAVDKIWDTKKARWAKAAESAPTLKQFLEDKFYGKN
jgi:tryptophan halogenase